MATTRKCSKCNEEKELGEFYKHKKGKNGIMSYCKLCQKKQSQTWKENNKDNMKIYRANNKERRQQWFKDNHERMRAYKRDYMKNKRQNDIAFRVLHNLRNRLWCTVVRKYGSTEELLGCTRDDVCLFLEAEFEEGMTWENYGEWHIDHIRPCASFNLEDPEEQQKCFHWTNLQPLWALDNIRKGAKIV